MFILLRVVGWRGGGEAMPGQAGPVVKVLVEGKKRQSRRAKQEGEWEGECLLGKMNAGIAMPIQRALGLSHS